ncbi:deleted in malignant brain tumors 1 protein-like [Dendronephthya gigantea]|uniref:deleted in malignant brain tumors 1 protein-like n=1 Tax=Dendronephthya gigantea TaxID=151771 RepID=UPI00106AB1EA|nr:deleted in malignant brain tumors 1 protein-like [Dendronephthya gigantea]
MSTSKKLADFSATPVLVRLQGPQSSNGTGRVEVFFHGIWGTICDYGWDIRDARVLCRQLGYLDAVRTLRADEVASGSGQIWLNFVDCTGEEQNITSCSHSPWGEHYCPHYYGVGVECSTTDISTTPVAVRLQGPLSKNGIGRVEVFYNGYWGTICDYGWDINDAKVVCRQLGFPDTVRILQRNLVPSGSGQIWLAYVACTGKEQNITSCPNNDWGNSFCSHYEDAGVVCSRTVITVSLRLQGPLSEDGTGRVEIFYNGTWGTICYSGWDMKDARVVCRQLGFKDVARELRSGQFPSGSGQVWLQSVDCTGSERDIARCSHSGWGVTSYYCKHSKDVGVECSRTDFSTTPVLLRLQGPVSEKGAGRVEVLYHGYWGTICDYSWSMRDATVVCRQLGYLDAVKTLQRNEFPPGSGQIWLSQVTCTGKEQNITSCSHRPWGDHYCSHNNDVGVECSTTAINVLIRLEGPSSKEGTGRVEIFYNGQWGTICDSGWDLRDARVACRQLGYPDSVRTLERNSVPSGSGKIWLTDVSCTGGEQNIASCFHNGWGVHSCHHNQDAGVQCSLTAITVSLRLQGQLSEDGTGRVEVLYKGQWGTICDNGWGLQDARVVCRQLGYHNVVRTLQRSEVIPGSGPIWLNNVDCTGEERNIESCSHYGWGVRSTLCSHDRDAGVECSPTDRPNVTVNCSSFIAVNLGDDITCLCEGKGGKPPTHVTYAWYKDGVQFSDTQQEQNVLTLSNVDEKDSGTYKCVGKIRTFTDEKSIEIDFYEKPNVTINCSSPIIVNIGDSVTCLCEGKNGYPPADVTWYKNDTQIGDTKKKENVLTLNIINTTNGGTYVCVGKSDSLAGRNSIEVLFSAVNVSLRLQGPLREDGTGRVEVYYKEKWGTICYNGWDLRDARVVCRQLGFPDAVRTLQRSEVIPGSGPIWLNNVYCTGKEENIKSCSHNGWGVLYSSCSHDYDAGVECSERPNVTVNCSSLIAVNLGDDITCLCEAKGGKPPANVTWYKDGVQFGDTEQEQNVLNLSNINETDNGTYKCVGRSSTLTDEKSIEVDFNYGK